MIRQLVIGRERRDEVIAHIESQMPLEACGLLAGKNNRVEKMLPVRNQAQSPVRFVMDPHEQLKAFEWIDSAGLDLLGIFHSHPTGPETASVTDIAKAAYKVVHVICSRSGGQWLLRGFWIENGQAAEVSLAMDG
jgi:proteasome lid subunit RPN8/RPN11